MADTRVNSDAFDNEVEKISFCKKNSNRRRKISKLLLNFGSSSNGANLLLNSNKHLLLAFGCFSLCLIFVLFSPSQSSVKQVYCSEQSTLKTAVNTNFNNGLVGETAALKSLPGETAEALPKNAYNYNTFRYVLENNSLPPSINKQKIGRILKSFIKSGVSVFIFLAMNFMHSMANANSYKNFFATEGSSMIDSLPKATPFLHNLKDSCSDYEYSNAFKMFFGVIAFMIPSMLAQNMLNSEFLRGEKARMILLAACIISIFVPIIFVKRITLPILYNFIAAAISRKLIDLDLHNSNLGKHFNVTANRRVVAGAIMASAGFVILQFILGLTRFADEAMSNVMLTTATTSALMLILKLVGKNISLLIALFAIIVPLTSNFHLNNFKYLVGFPYIAEFLSNTVNAAVKKLPTYNQASNQELAQFFPFFHPRPTEENWPTGQTLHLTASLQVYPSGSTQQRPTEENFYPSGSTQQRPTEENFYPSGSTQQRPTEENLHLTASLQGPTGQN